MQRHASFGVPLQVLSLPRVHKSEEVGVTLQPPQAPAMHVLVPAAQVPLAPSFEPQDPVIPFTHAQPSCGTPLQLSSLSTPQASRSEGTLLHAPHAPDEQT